MRPTFLLVLANCSRTAPTVDGSFATTLGDDDDAVTDGVTPGTAGTPCDRAGFSPPPTSSGGELVAELHELTRAQSCNDYSAVTDWMFVVLDNEAGEVECVYTGRRTPVN